METEHDAIRFDHVSLSIGETDILKGINNGISKGRITTLVGPSGSGKTTLFRLCNGLISPTTGKIYILGKEIGHYHPVELRKQVGIVFQSVTMIKGTIKDNLELPLRLRGKSLSDERAKKLLDVIGLPTSFLTRKSDSLSGGQKQRVSIARSLVNRPDILLLDEITSSLDTVSQHEIEELIKHINDEFKTTIVWITHNLRQAVEVGDDSWVMMDGEVVETGESSFLNDPTNERVKDFVRSELL